jgi:hypothetical protein
MTGMAMTPKSQVICAWNLYSSAFKKIVFAEGKGNNSM